MKQGIECLNSCIYNWLINDNIHINMSDIYFLGNGFNMHYTGNYGTHMIYTEQYEANKRFVRKYAPDSVWDNYIEEDIDSIDNKKVFLINMLEKYQRIIIRLSSSSLSYNKKFSRDKEISHYITVVGYEKNHFMIYDACPPVTDKDVYSGEIDDKDLLDNWNTYNNEYLILRYERDAFKEDRIREEVIAARNNQLKDYLKNPLLSNKKRYRGYRCFISLLEDMQSIFSNNIDTKGVMAECNRQLRIEGFEQSKKFIFDNIFTSGSDFENHDYQNQKYQEYQEIVKHWDKLIMNMFKAGIKGNVDLFNQVIEEAKRLILEENRILKNIIKE